MAPSQRRLPVPSERHQFVAHSSSRTRLLSAAQEQLSELRRAQHPGAPCASSRWVRGKSTRCVSSTCPSCHASGTCLAPTARGPLPQTFMQVAGTAMLHRAAKLFGTRPCLHVRPSLEALALALWCSCCSSIQHLGRGRPCLHCMRAAPGGGASCALLVWRATLHITARLSATQHTLPSQSLPVAPRHGGALSN